MEQDLVCAICGKTIKDERTIQFSTTGEVVCVDCVHEYTDEEMEDKFGFHVEE